VRKGGIEGGGIGVVEEGEGRKRSREERREVVDGGCTGGGSGGVQGDAHIITKQDR
jgi:hypothetical protein